MVLGITMHMHTYIKTHFKIHDSESRGQEEAVHDEQGSYLHIAPLKTSQTL